MVMFFRVTRTDAFAAIVPLRNVMTMLELLLALLKASTLGFTLTLGVTPDKKNPKGYTSVTWLTPPSASSPPAVGVNPKVTLTLVALATRKDSRMKNEKDVTVPPMNEDLLLEERVGSMLVCTVTSPPALAGPNVQPASVTVTAVEAESGSPVTDNTMDVTPGACGVRVVSDDDEVAVGVAEVEKKPKG